jgi:tetratricopeptide (TPR) repeat protein
VQAVAAGQRPAAASPPQAQIAEPAADPPGASPGASPPAADPIDPKEAAKEAGKEKAKCRTLIERGRFTDAITAGEQSISLDPTDSEAWLLLGAAYQQKGDAKNAVRSFKACVDQGKRGPKWDCAAMLR